LFQRLVLYPVDPPFRVCAQRFSFTVVLPQFPPLSLLMPRVFFFGTWRRFPSLPLDLYRGVLSPSLPVLLNFIFDDVSPSFPPFREVFFFSLFCPCLFDCCDFFCRVRTSSNTIAFFFFPAFFAIWSNCLFSCPLIFRKPCRRFPFFTSLSFSCRLPRSVHPPVYLFVLTSFFCPSRNISSYCPIFTTFFFFKVEYFLCSSCF